MANQKVMTVRGPVDPNVLGFTLTHEHLCLNLGNFYTAAPSDVEAFLDKKIKLHNVGYVRQYPYSSKYNLVLDDDDASDAVQQDVIQYKKLGGSTIVENTSHGLSRNLKQLHALSTATDVQIVAGTGHYIQAAQPDSVLSMTIEELEDLYTKEILFGVTIASDTAVCCGLIGEVGTSWPITSFEKRTIQATAEAQSTLQCPVSFHPGLVQEAPFEVVRLYLEAGGKADKCVMSHMDLTMHATDDLLEFAKLGTYCQFDLFGNECSYQQLVPQSYMQSDEQRIQHILELIEEGFAERILLSHDVHTKHRLTSFGGHGYGHILTNILMRLSLKDVNKDTIDMITVENPAKWLAMPK
ncbi:phosphotriesterase-related protein-like [Sabethes cyaneus]|uniref:phosphotriesterase-related protein-like n=1 Tax=Sabethes cyaneus TaxID=53552 RepID=UPI00237D5863|nr:phosphotriesterase-related protein-like [Sabethes cyaneus]XP_053682843.1 phosphotriesterase-related protein-like [Sabethes cyaneus]